MHRSYLYVPGDQPTLLTKALGLQGDNRPDVIIIDLEDAVAPNRKLVARDAAAKLAATSDADQPAIFVRINPGDLDDLSAVVGAGLGGVIVPKASPKSIAAAANHLAAANSAADLVALIETATGLASVNDIASVPGVSALAVGEADLGSELGIAEQATWAWWPIRMNLVIASATFGLEPPTGPVSTTFRDLTGFEQTTRDLRAAGFGARPAIHPAQVPIINAVMKPSAAEIEHARQLVDQYDQALALGLGVTTGADGAMIDEAVAGRYRRML
jgi:citrate lyase subunit beta / citryl-CoA lyase